MSLEIHHFTFGFVTPVAACLVSVIGCFLGLRCAAKARTGGSGIGWLCAAAIAIGGTGVWGTYFIAMLGFSIADTQVRYSVPLTLAGAFVAIGAVGIGLGVVSTRRSGALRLLLGGALTGGGVVALHFTGMMALHTTAEIHCRPVLVAASAAIAVAAATLALWCARWVDGWALTTGAAVILGVAVTGMHYAGMAAITARASAAGHADALGGVRLVDLVTPLLVVVGLTLAELLLNVGMDSPDEPPSMAEHTVVPRQVPVLTAAQRANAEMTQPIRVGLIGQKSIRGQMTGSAVFAAQRANGPNLLNEVLRPRP